MKRVIGEGSHGKSHPRPGSAFLPESAGHVHLEGVTLPSSYQIQQTHEMVGMGSADVSMHSVFRLEAAGSLVAHPEAPILSKVCFIQSFGWVLMTGCTTVSM